MILAEPVGEHIPLNLEQFRDHQHQCVDVDDESDDRQVPAKEKKFYYSDHGKTCISRKHRVILLFLSAKIAPMYLGMRLVSCLTYRTFN